MSLSLQIFIEFLKQLKNIIYNRKICVIGRSMEKNLEFSNEFGLYKIPKDQFIEAHESK